MASSKEAALREHEGEWFTRYRRRLLPSRRAYVIVTAILLGLWLAVVIFTALRHEYWRDEVRAWSLAREATSPLDLFHRIRYEGHPILWYLLLYVGKSIVDTPLVLPITSIVIASAAVTIFMLRSPFPLWMKASFLFSALPLYVYSVKARNYAYQVLQVGARSLALATVMAAFAGMVMAFQFGYGLERFGAKLYIGQTTVTALVRELGPILTALVAGGRIGAGIAAELGGMAVTEQLDAVRALGADPLQRLVAPRLLATTMALPLLAVCADAVGAGGGMVVAWLQYGVSPRLYVNGVYDFVTIGDFGSGLAKATVFGACIGAISCAAGLRARGGTEGVGRATTQAVVAGALVVLGADFILTKLMLTL